jgi:hypothetical protein
MRAICLILAVFMMGGCVSYKNPGPSGPPAYTGEEVKRRISVRIGVRVTEEAAFNSLPNAYERKWRYEAARQESERLVRILADCQLFDEVVLLEEAGRECDFELLALPRTGERTSLDDPWLLLYGGVVPSYSKNERGICFRFVKGASGDVIFRWTEEMVVGLWAPVVSGSKGWTSSRRASTYWRDLRAEMYRVFSEVEKAANEFPSDGS